MIQLRVDEGLNIGFTIQVDTLCHKIPNFIEKATQAGVRRVFIGLENINPDNLIGGQEAPEQDHRIPRSCCRNGASTAPSPMRATSSAFPGDTKESIMRDIEIIKRELPLDILEFFFLTPLPGSEDHKGLWTKGVWMDPDMNKYDLNHRVSHHAKMSDAEWEEAYRTAWETYYTPEHIRTILRRAAANPLGRLKTTLTTILWFYLAFKYEGVHPLEAGVFRLKFRRDRRLEPAAREPVRVLSALCRRDAGQGLARIGRCIAAPRRCSRRSRPRRTAGPIPTSRSRRRSTTSSRRSISTTRPPAARPRSTRKRRDEAIRAGVHAPVRRPAAARRFPDRLPCRASGPIAFIAPLMRTRQVHRKRRLAGTLAQ